jgi:hypothetical protein
MTGEGLDRVVEVLNMIRDTDLQELSATRRK